MIIPNYTWSYMVPHSCTWLYIVVDGCSQLYTVIHSCIWLLTVVYGCKYLYIVVQGYTHLYKTVHGFTSLCQPCTHTKNFVQPYTSFNENWNNFYNDLQSISCYINIYYLRKVSIKKHSKLWNFPNLGGGLPDFHNFFQRKKCFFHRKYRDDHNGIIHPEKWRL